jgi:hypothetical protein
MKMKQVEKKWFDLEYRLVGKKGWRPAMSSGTYEPEAISNFAMDYSASMGTVCAVRVVANGKSARKLHNLIKKAR